MCIERRESRAQLNFKYSILILYALNKLLNRNGPLSTACAPHQAWGVARPTASRGTPHDGAHRSLTQIHIHNNNHI